METAEAFRKTVTAERFWREPLLAPEPGCRTSPFGVRRDYNGKPSGNYHGGVDQRGAAGTPVHAIATGTVRVVEPWSIHGNTVGVDHGQGVASMYLHLSRFAVAEGAQLKQGDVVGYVGSTGRSTAPHLHWSLYVHGVAVNPERWVKLAACGAPPAPTPKRPVRRRAAAR
jgi:lysostaphin